jgi:hypothetical protein
VVKTIGDEIARSSSAPISGGSRGRDAGSSLGKQPPVGRSRLAIRVGFHFGPAIVAEGDVFRRFRQRRGAVTGAGKGRSR